jgi:hypothetical protein
MIVLIEVRTGRISRVGFKQLDPVESIGRLKAK